MGITTLRGFHSLASVVFCSRTLVCHKPKARFATEDYHVIIGINIPVDRMARRLMNIAIYAGWTSHSTWQMSRELLHGTSVCGLSTIGILAAATTWGEGVGTVMY